MYSAATTVDEYLDELSEDRRASMETVRKVILDNISEGYEEIMQFGMIGYVIPLERYPVTYNGQALSIAALCSQKNYMSVYLMNVYGDRDAVNVVYGGSAWSHHHSYPHWSNLGTSQEGKAGLPFVTGA